MPYIIDGYNLLHVTGVFGTGAGAGTLERARGALLNSLVLTMEPSDCAQTTIVFDAQDAPPGLPRQWHHEGIEVIFADRTTDADGMIEELIQLHSAPRTLTVVSSDHRIQRAARRRRAVAVDSDVWYRNLLQRRRQRETKELSRGSSISEKPQLPLTPEKLDQWLVEFNAEEVQAFWRRESKKTEFSSPAGLPPNGSDEEDEEIGQNPFPPGYGADLQE